MINQISAFRFTTYKQNQPKYNSAQDNFARKISFWGAIPAKELIKRGVKISNYFRRGGTYGLQNPDYSRIEEAIEELYKHKKKLKLLVVGIGRAQEPFSILATINSLKKGENLKSVVDLHCVELHPKMHEEDLKNFSYLDTGEKPLFAADSFDNIQNSGRFKVKDNIFEYLKGVFNNPKKAHFETRVEDFAKQKQSQKFDAIFINNVLMYMPDEKKEIKTVKNLWGMLKTKGCFVSDVDANTKSPFLNDNIRLNSGIWQKQPVQNVQLGKLLARVTRLKENINSDAPNAQKIVVEKVANKIFTYWETKAHRPEDIDKPLKQFNSEILKELRDLEKSSKVKIKKD